LSSKSQEIKVQVPDGLKCLTPNMGYLLKQHSQNMEKIILFILGFGWGSDKTSTTHRISLNALKVNSYINAFFCQADQKQDSKTENHYTKMAC
jgi:hypothetical protein